KQASEELKGTKPKKSGDAYTFDFDNGSGITSHAIIMGDDEFVAVITITGEHDDIEGILDSMGGLE
ncbi:MAG: hypothetical protein LBS93_02615, partial [Synergistaceae bacterium]|nr:hypothetical protein [Synergistaceae bacterium]